MQPLSGLLVLDFTTLLPGPLATLMLAEAGAEVIKIERPGGEDMRHYEPRFDGESAMFALLNRGKTEPGARSQERRPTATSSTPLIERADVLVEQFRPGVMARLGLGYEAVRAINPRLVYCSITGYGQTGPRADEAGHDLNYIGNTGLLALNPGPARPAGGAAGADRRHRRRHAAGGDQHPARRCASATGPGRAAISTSP